MYNRAVGVAYTYVGGGGGGGCAARAGAVAGAGAGGGGSTRAPGTYWPINDPSSVKRPAYAYKHYLLFMYILVL